MCTKQEHNCFKNYNAYCPGMDVEALNVFHRSESAQNVMYVLYLSDGTVEV